MYLFKDRKISVFLGLFATFILVVLDQATKLFAISALKDKPDIILIKGVLQLHYLENNGAAFSMLEGKQFFFRILTPVFLIIICYIYYKLANVTQFKGTRIIIIFVVAGAIGNYIDRLRFEYVVDFIYFSLINFPVFNIADCYVTCSVFALIFLIMFKYTEADLDDMSKLVLPGKKYGF